MTPILDSVKDRTRSWQPKSPQILFVQKDDTGNFHLTRTQPISDITGEGFEDDSLADQEAAAQIDGELWLITV